MRYFDLNLYESKVYLAVIRGANNPREISKLSGVPLPRIYDTLDSLERIGLINVSEKGVIPFEPKIAIKNRLIELAKEFQKEQRIRSKAASQLLKILSNISGEIIKGNDVLILRGLSPIAAKMLEVCEKSKDIFFVVRKGLKVKEDLKPYLEGLKSKRIRFLIYSKLKLEEEDLKFLKKLGAEVAFSNSVMLDLLVADGKEAIVGLPSAKETAIAIWIGEENFSKSLMEAVEEIWNSSSHL